MKVICVATFSPNTVGRVKTNIFLEMIDNLYRIPITVIGDSKAFSSKRPATRGPESLPPDYTMENKFFDDEIKENSTIFVR